MKKIYLSGKVQPHKPPIRSSRLKMIKGLTSRFRGNLLFILSEIELNAPTVLENQDIKVQYANLVKETHTVIEQINASVYKIKLALRKEVLNLRKLLESFNENLQKNSVCQTKFRDENISCIYALTDEIDEFIVHFNTICDLIWNGDEFPFKVSDRNKKKRFLDAVVHYYQLNQKAKFAPYFWILRHLKIDQNELSPRTYGMWKKQLDAGTFHHFVQPKK